MPKGNETNMLVTVLLTRVNTWNQTKSPYDESMIHVHNGGTTKTGKKGI